MHTNVGDYHLLQSESRIESQLTSKIWRIGFVSCKPHGVQLYLYSEYPGTTNILGVTEYMHTPSSSPSSLL